MTTSGSTRDALEIARGIPLFAQVADADLEQIASHLIERRYPRNTTIVEEGLPGDYMYIIREGRVKVTKLSDDGREKILEFLDEGAFVGEMALLERAPRSASVKTLTPVRLLALSRIDFIRLLKKSPDLAMSVIQELSRRLRVINEQASALSFQRVKDRTKGLLERLARDPCSDSSRRRTPSLTHQQIADMIGTSRETVTRVVKELKADGWLEQEGKHYLVPTEALED
jgi:CRP-like cAMP-binding protein